MQDATPLPQPEGCGFQSPAASLPMPPPRAARRPWSDTLLASIILFAIVQGFVIQGYQVFGSCMEPNLNTGERLLGSKVALLEGVHRGDVVVFQPPHREGTAFIKRVIGLPGEVLEIHNNRVFVNGHMLNEPYLHREWHDDRAPERIASDMVFVLGDNRDNSNDSRFWGELPLKNIQAKAWVRYWPPDKLEVIQ
jgi:signal peptidase I